MTSGAAVPPFGLSAGQREDILELILDSVYIFRASDLRFIYANGSACRELGYSMDELTQLTPLDIKPAFTVEQFETMLLPLRDGRQQAHAFQTRHRHKDGEESPVQVFLQCFDAEGAEPYFLAVARDLSTLRQADAALVASEAKYRRIVETAQEGVWMIDEHDRTVLVNRSMGAMLGYAEPEMMGRSMYDFMNPAAVTLAQQNVERRGRASRSSTTSSSCARTVKSSA